MHANLARQEEGHLGRPVSPKLQMELETGCWSKFLVPDAFYDANQCHFRLFTFHYATKQLLRDSLYPLLCPNFEKCKQNINNCSARVVSHRLQF